MAIRHYNYSKDDLVGTGTFGQVYLGNTRKEPPSPIVIKLGRKEWDGHVDLGPEAIIMMRINGLIPHTLMMRDHFSIGDRVGLLIFDRGYSSNKPSEKPLNIKQLLKGISTFSTHQVISCMKQLFECLAALKKHKIVHRDIKAANLIFNRESNQLYVLDFGAACLLENHKKWNGVGTEPYRAPELFLQQKADYGMDLWSAGVLLFELYTGGLLPFGYYENEIIRHILTTLGVPSDSYLKSCKLSKRVIDEACHPDFKVDWKAMIHKAAKDRNDSEAQADEIIDLLEKIFVYEGRISIEKALNLSLFKPDVHLKLDCQGVPHEERKQLFLSSLSLQIPLSARCIHLPTTEKQEYEMQIRTAEKCVHTFKATLNPGGSLRISKSQDEFKVVVDDLPLSQFKNLSLDPDECKT